MMAIRERKSRLTIRDFKEEDAKFVYKCGDYEIVFYEEYGGWAKKYVQVWYLEGGKKYKKEEKVFDSRANLDKWTVRENSRQIWFWINKFRDKYCNE